MISKQGEIVQRIQAACPEAKVVMDYPAGWSHVPLVAVYETENRTAAWADGGEFLTEVVYTADIWSEDAEEAERISGKIDVELSGMGFRRLFCAEMFEEKTRYRRRCMRFRALADATGNLYQ